MNKISHRHEAAYQISKIQANLKQMKEQIEGYLKKHNKEVVPPILRGRHYLLVDSMNHLAGSKPYQNHHKFVKDLSPEALWEGQEAQKFEPLRIMNPQKHEKNKIVKQKKVKIGRNNLQSSADQELNCLLPNICNLKLQYDDSFIANASSRRPLKEEKHVQEHIQEQPLRRSLNSKRKYQSIDIGRQSLLQESKYEDMKTNIRGSKRKWFTKSISRPIPKNLLFGNVSFNSITKHLDYTETNQQQEQSKQIHDQRSIDSNIEENQLHQTIFHEQSHLIQRKNRYPIIDIEGQKPFKLRLSLAEKRLSEFSLQRLHPKPKQKEIHQQLNNFQPWQNEEEQEKDSQFVLNRDIY